MINKEFCPICKGFTVSRLVTTSSSAKCNHVEMAAIIQHEPDYNSIIVSELVRLKEDGHVFMPDSYIPQFAGYINEAIKKRQECYTKGHVWGYYHSANETMCNRCGEVQ